MEKISADELIIMANEKLISDLLTKAEKNWCQSQNQELKRLICSVIFKKRYDRVNEEDLKQLETR